MKTFATSVFALMLVSTMSAATRQRPISAATAAGNPSTLTGTWYVSLSFSPSGETGATLTLVQVGSNVGGTAALVDGGSGAISGTVSGNTFTFSASAAGACPGSFTGSASIGTDHRTLDGSITGSDCFGSLNADVFGVNQSATGGAEPSANVTGLWDATLTVSGSPAAISFTLVQTGSAVTGTASLTSGGGAIFGNVSGDSVQFTLYEVSPCAGSFIGAATVSADDRNLNGSFFGSDCGGQISGTLTATKR